MKMGKCSILYTLIRSSRKTAAIQIGAGGQPGMEHGNIRFFADVEQAHAAPPFVW